MSSVKSESESSESESLPAILERFARMAAIALFCWERNESTLYIQKLLEATMSSSTSTGLLALEVKASVGTDFKFLEPDLMDSSRPAMGSSGLACSSGTFRSPLSPSPSPFLLRMPPYTRRQGAVNTIHALINVILPEYRQEGRAVERVAEEAAAAGGQVVQLTPGPRGSPSQPIQVAEAVV